MGWIRIRMDPELLPGSGFWKIQSWIRIQNKSFRIRDIAKKYRYSPTHRRFLRHLKLKLLSIP